jgi:DNA-binding NarL/FixJ family response regulator
MILDAQPDMEVVADASDGAEAIHLASRTHPHVVLMDIRMPTMDGIEATQRLTTADLDPPPRVVILTTYDLDEYVFDALAAGASGFLLKDVTPEDLVRAIRVVAQGEALLAPSITRRLIEQFARHPPGGLGERTLDELTQREREVLRFVARGRSNAEIADALFLSPSTVKTHVGHILEKFALRDRVQAAILAYEAGLVRPGEADSQ